MLFFHDWRYLPTSFNVKGLTLRIMEETSYHTPWKCGNFCREIQWTTRGLLSKNKLETLTESVFGQHSSVFNSVDGSNLVTVDSVNELRVGFVCSKPFILTQSLTWLLTLLIGLWKTDNVWCSRICYSWFSLMIGLWGDTEIWGHGYQLSSRFCECCVQGT